jgi:hypothetical protein
MEFRNGSSVFPEIINSLDSMRVCHHAPPLPAGRDAQTHESSWNLTRLLAQASVVALEEYLIKTSLSSLPHDMFVRVLLCAMGEQRTRESDATVVKSSHTIFAHLLSKSQETFDKEVMHI